MYAAPNMGDGFPLLTTRERRSSLVSAGKAQWDTCAACPRVVTSVGSPEATDESTETPVSSEGRSMPVCYTDDSLQVRNTLSSRTQTAKKLSKTEVVASRTQAIEDPGHGECH